MFKTLKQRKAQSVMAEYLLVFFLIVGMISAMTVYFRRAIQGRVFDAQRFVLRDIANRVEESGFNGVLYSEYEPYSAQTESAIYHLSVADESLVPDAPGKTGISRRNIDDYT